MFFRAIMWTFIGIVGLAGTGTFYGYYRFGYDIETLRLFSGLGLIVGLLVGPVFGVLMANLSSPRMVFEHHRVVNCKLATCAWCHKTGRQYSVIPLITCRVCGGQGSVLAPEQRRKCAWCKGTGREFAVLRCRVCDGSGWVYGHADKKR